MRKKKTDVIVWDHGEKLIIDLPKGSVCYTLSNGTMRVTVETPVTQASALDSIVDIIGRRLITKEVA